jgi:hypothetical protein
MLCKLFVVTVLGVAFASPKEALAQHYNYENGISDYKQHSSPARATPGGSYNWYEDPNACWVWWEGQLVLVC